LQDAHQQAVIGCALIGSNFAHLESAMHTISRWVESNWTDGDVIEQKMEIIG
jgi:uncharacterized protein YlxP (DUF503 family)